MCCFCVLVWCIGSVDCFGVFVWCLWSTSAWFISLYGPPACGAPACRPLTGSGPAPASGPNWLAVCITLKPLVAKSANMGLEISKSW